LSHQLLVVSHDPHPKSELATSFFVLLALGTPLLTPGTICPTAACQDLMLVDFGFALLDLLAFRFAFPTLPLLLGDTPKVSRFSVSCVI
jgi:hypothetical protein